MTKAAFAYYLPALLILSMEEPFCGLDSFILSHTTVTTFQSDTTEPTQEMAELTTLAAQWTVPQTNSLAHYLDWLHARDVHCPAHVKAARTLASEGIVLPVSYDEVMSWIANNSRPH
jgi:hypothetical protein